MRSLAARVERQRLGALGIVGSGLLHASLVVALLLGARHPEPRRMLPAYRVDLVAAPRAAAPEPSPAEPAAPAPVPVPPARPTPQPVRREPAARPAPAVPSPATRPPSAAATAPATAAAQAPGPAPGGAEGAPGGAGADPATIRTEGVEFPFPGYLRNLVAQVYRRWQPPSGNANLEAEILFLVHRDGSISGLRFVRRSGAFGFDLEAQGAVEAAARSNAFGPLPAGYGADVLPVSFFFSPRSLR
jgi:protein TonB